MIELSVIRDLVAIFGVIAGFTYYVITVRANRRTQQQQLEIRESQLYMNIYNQSYSNPDFLNRARIIHMKIPEIKSADDFIKAYDYFNPTPEDPEFLEAWNSVSSFFEGLGVFIKEGLIDIRLVALTMSGMTLTTWGIVEPYLEEIREYFGFKRWMSEWEYLVNELRAYHEANPELAPFE